MPDSRSLYTHACAASCHGPIYAALACLVLWLSFAVPLHAAEPVEIVVTGIDGDALKNVQEALVLPAGLVREGTVDRLWLDRFALTAKETVRSALEPFGYYQARVTVTVDPPGERYRLLVTVRPPQVVPGVAEVEIRSAGQGVDRVRIAARVLRAHKFRSFLTLVLVILGTMSMVFMITMIQALKVMIWDGIQSLGFDGVMFVAADTPQDQTERADDGQHDEAAEEAGEQAERTGARRF